MWKVNFDARVGRIEGFTRWKEIKKCWQQRHKEEHIFKIKPLHHDFNLPHPQELLTWRVCHGHQEVVAGWGGGQPGGGAGPGGRPVQGRGAGGRAVEGGAGRGHAVTDAAQAGAEAQHQAGRAARLKYRGSEKRTSQLLRCEICLAIIFEVLTAKNMSNHHNRENIHSSITRNKHRQDRASQILLEAMNNIGCEVGTVQFPRE